MKNVNIICIIDKSGSMESIVGKAIEGFNSFLKEQQKADYQAYMSVMLFDTAFQKFVKHTKIKNVEPLTRKTYRPDGGTALLDAIGISIDEFLDWLGKHPKEERPEKTLFVILTDGEENSSTQYHSELIKLMVNEMRELFNCEFIYLGANQDACLQAERMGMSRSNAYNYAATDDGVTVAYASASKATTTYMTTDSKENLFEEEQK